MLGTVEANTDIGIYGTLTGTSAQNGTDDLYPVGYKQEIKTGSAVLLSDVSGESCCYHIEIDSVDYAAESNKGIRFHVDDEELLALTGGIVQGLSGSPIIQNGRLVGAVTHVLVSDPTRGYGIFIEDMLTFSSE
jgi:stage IV sporulation protein B